MSKRYFVPTNFAKDGYIYGNIRIRNLIECLFVFLVIGVPFIKFVPLPVRPKIYVTVIVLIPLLILTFRGIKGLSFTEFVRNLIETVRNRRVFSTPTNKDKIVREKNLIRKKHKEIRMQEKEARAARRNQKKQEGEEQRGKFKKKKSEE
ncbi:MULTISPECIES: hypothetical protein [Clostridia]|uniref:hypothetical protein n=1 Tax=Clostridia TaxID=186801 RepID=UPI000E4949ED|nr:MULTISPECIES: hypothetical protein [Clostridia]RHV71047.1 hypothetical protein DXB15_03815 [Roseburia sp. OM02-15]